ncbi:MAG: cytochrome-c oxidase, cbb3-type subunit I [Proteobacteria bacterium]|nr:cytochrome-c oxidase, cbb3-type subunit I [Pseudomonadota bacterium]
MGSATNAIRKFDDDIIRLFVIATLFWMITGLTFGLIIASQLAFPELNLGVGWGNFGRLRPMHTSGVILGFGGNVLFATSLFVVQRTCQARLAFPALLRPMFYGYQLVLILALSGYMMGITQGREYAEPEWQVDILLTIVWIFYFLVYIGTVMKRQEPHIYVANWFYMAFIMVVAMLHIGNNIAIPLAWNSPESVDVFSGVQSAMIQWWYGHNMVGFFLTTGFLGIMYYFIPKRANRPVYSYRLSIMHFWALVFLYIWAGAHHLMYTALPDWVQTLGMTMSLMLWLPSWGGAINGIMTLSGAWHKLREDPVLQFLVIAVAFYGMSTFEGPMLAIKSVNALGHYTEWVVSHVHSGALGWVAMISFGALYYLVPILWGKPTMYSMRLVSIHLWLASIGIVLYITSMWAAGITQGLMWRSYDHLGFLQYSFVEVVASLHPYYVIRMIGGSCFLIGALIMIYNVYKTIMLQEEKLNEPIMMKAASPAAAAA